jgi:Phage tail tube protein
MAQRVAGTAFLKVDGNQYPLRGNLTVTPSVVERAGIAGQDYIHGFSELPRVPSIEGDVTTAPGLAIEDFDGMTNVTITAELANNSLYVLREGWCVSALAINARDGLVRIRFEGISCDEIQP